MARVAALNDVHQPGGAAADRHGRRVRREPAFRSACAATPAAIRGDPALLEAGLRDLSVAPAQLALAKAAIAAVGSDGLSPTHQPRRGQRRGDPRLQDHPREVIDQRPSGTRQRLADALGKHRSFVTQITSPTYSTPIPAKHLPTIFSVCHFSPAERDPFLAAYERAHPARRRRLGELAQRRATCRWRCPISATTSRTRALDRAITEFVATIAGAGWRQTRWHGRNQ